MIWFRGHINQLTEEVEEVVTLVVVEVVVLLVQVLQVAGLLCKRRLSLQQSAQALPVLLISEAKFQMRPWVGGPLLVAKALSTPFLLCQKGRLVLLLGVQQLAMLWTCMQ